MEYEKKLFIPYKDTELEVHVLIRSAIVDNSFSTNDEKGIVERFDEEISAVEILEVRDFLTSGRIEVTPDIRHLVEREVLL